MRGTAWFSGTVALAVAFGCGGSTSSDPGSTGGTAGTGGVKATGGAGGTGNVGGGVGGGVVGGSGGVCDPSACGPDGAPCCEPFSGCGVSGLDGSLSCECTSALVWQCVATGGAGGAGGCDPSACGPHGAPCCQPGSGCGTAGGGAPPLSCNCTSAGVWDCIGGGGGSGGGTGFCNGPSDCAAGTTCCSGKCVNLVNDPFNCGACGNTCAGFPPYCSGQCTKPPCWAPTPPPPGAICCGQNYCKPGMLCCDVQGPGPSGGPTCFSPTPEQPTCPIGCPLCQ